MDGGWIKEMPVEPDSTVLVTIKHDSATADVTMFIFGPDVSPATGLCQEHSFELEDDPEGTWRSRLKEILIGVVEVL